MSKEVSIPKMADFPEPVTQTKRWNDMATEKSRLWTEIQALQAEAAASGELTHYDRVADGARKLLDPNAAATLPRTKSEILAEIGEKTQAFETYAEAERLQAGIVAQAKLEASRTICAAAEAPWKAILVAGRKLAKALRENVKAEQEFRDRIIADGATIVPPLSNQAASADRLSFPLGRFIADCDQILGDNA